MTVARAARPALAAAVLAVLVWRLGTGPFLDGLRRVDARALVAASAVAMLTTAACAYRWRIVARGLGVPLDLRTAFVAYYRSLFLNVALPGGIAGDVHRAVRRGVRAVFWERAAGQAVQAVLTVAVLLVAPSPVRAAAPFAAGALLAAAVAVAVAARRRPAGDLRTALLARRAWPGIAVASAVVVAGHVATFVLAARTAGVTAPVADLVALALLALTAAALPNVGGWGPREGATAWAFAAAGLGASAGVATAVVYGVLVVVASLPGAAVLVGGRARRRHPGRRRRPRPLVLSEGALDA